MNMVHASTSISFFSVLKFSEYRSFIFLVRFIIWHFILFETIVNGIVFLISICVSSLLAHKNVIDFWILILYPATLLNSFISSSYLVESLEISMYSIVSTANKNNFTSSFPICILFLPLVCLLYLGLPVLV